LREGSGVEHSVEDARFRKNYDKYRAGLADFMRAAMEYCCDHALKK